MTTSRNKINFTVVVDGQTLELCVEKPSVRQQEEAQKIYAGAVHSYLKAGAALREGLETFMRDQNLWSESKDEEVAVLSNRIQENIRVVSGQVKGVTLTKAREAAIQVRRDRAALNSLLSVRSEVEANSAQGQAENQRLNFLVSCCTKYADTGDVYFGSHEEYLERQNDPVATEAANRFAQLWYGHDPDAAHKLPENAFLKKYGFCREKDLHLVKVVNGKTHLCDTEGRLVNEEGYFVNEAGERVNARGDRVDDEGNLIVETFEFIDDRDVLSPASPSEEEREVLAVASTD